MKSESKQRREAQWAAIIRECVKSGMTKTEWCRRHGISLRTFFSYQRKIGNVLAADSKKNEETINLEVISNAAELPLQANRVPEHDENIPVAVIRHGGTEIAVTGGISPELLSILLERICHAQ